MGFRNADAFPAVSMTDAWGGSVNRSFAGKIPWKEYGEPEHADAAVAFLVPAPRVASIKIRWI